MKRSPLENCREQLIAEIEEILDRPPRRSVTVSTYADTKFYLNENSVSMSVSLAFNEMRPEIVVTRKPGENRHEHRARQARARKGRT
jgi:hypothetical protein